MKKWIIVAIVAVVAALGIGCGTGALKCTPSNWTANQAGG